MCMFITDLLDQSESDLWTLPMSCYGFLLGDDVFRIAALMLDFVWSCDPSHFAVTAVWNVTYQIWTNLFHFEFLIDAKLNFYFICSLYWPKLSFVFILPWRLYAGFHALYLNIVFCEFEIRSKKIYQTLFFFSFFVQIY